MSKRFKWPSLGLTLALVSAVLTQTAWPLITSDAPNSHILPSTGGTLFGYGPGDDMPPMGDPPPSFIGNKLWVEPLDYTGVAELIVDREDPDTGRTSTIRATGSLLSYADRSVLITAAHVVGDGPTFGIGVRRVEALSVTAEFTKADGSIVQYVQDNTGWSGNGDGANGGRVFFPPQYDGVVYHGHEVAFIFLDEPVDDQGIASYKLTSTADIPDPLNRPTVKIGYGQGGYGSYGRGPHFRDHLICHYT